VNVFITATGTEVGKTYVTCGLAMQLRREGRAPLAIKPVVSGFNEQSPVGSDPARLLTAQGREVDKTGIDAIAPWRFATPVSPNWAAALEARSIDYTSLIAYCRAAVSATRPTLIEGIGGLMVPLDPTRTVLDLMTDLALPVVLVAGSYLGTLSHALTALTVLRQTGLPCIAVISETAATGIDAACVAAEIGSRTAVPCFLLRRTPPTTHDPCFGDIVRAIEGL
jgi:dethiobiotin synthetase